MDKELRALRLSAWGQLFFGVLGLSFALYTESEAILLDGYFSLIGRIGIPFSVAKLGAPVQGACRPSS